MVAAWILYCALWALWLSAVAWVAERLVLNARGPARVVWIGAMVLSVVGPAISYRLPRTDRVVAAPSVAASTSSISTGADRVMHAPPPPPIRASFTATIRATMQRIDRPLAVAWIALSITFVLYVCGGVLRLRVLRRRWEPRTIAGTPVMISENTGPALLGVFDTTIVIPAWALALDEDALALMLRHELEHRAAGDTRTVALAQALLVLMPWNVMLWWQVRRLRLAIELDCDARVLRATSDIAAYGALLLEFGQHRQVIGLAGAGLADHHASQLETRIRRMSRRATVQRGRALGSVLAAGSVAIAVGCEFPTPPQTAAPPWKTASPSTGRDLE